MARYQLLKRLEALEQLADTQPVADTKERELEAAIAADPVLVEILSRVPKGRYGYDPRTNKRVRFGPRLRIEDIDPDEAEIIILRTDAIRNRLEGDRSDS